MRRIEEEREEKMRRESEERYTFFNSLPLFLYIRTYVLIVPAIDFFSESKKRLSSVNLCVYNVRPCVCVCVQKMCVCDVQKEGRRRTTETSGS